ncbi:hypothetical protein HBB16_17130 [Pseudonocardia sp. MCCB 268]|nr:hypothetical protein [Pseudonocardia cytotoxica]
MTVTGINGGKVDFEIVEARCAAYARWLLAKFWRWSWAWWARCSRGVRHRPGAVAVRVLAGRRRRLPEVDARTRPPPGVAGPRRGLLWVPVSALTTAAATRCGWSRSR